jgi:predicted transcriptional regulator
MRRRHVTDGKSRSEHMSKYRSRLDIVSLMLGILSEGPATKSKMMYGAYLSYEQLNRYVDYLVSKRLITLHSGTQSQQRLYSLTERGLRVLRVSETIAELLQVPSAVGN